MNLEMCVQIATIVTLLLTAGTLLFGMYSFGKQINCQVYLAYTERYEKIMESFPPVTLESRLKFGETLPQRSTEFSVCILRYLNLCSEEFFLYKKGFLSRKIWTVWQPEIERMLKSPVIKREWQHIRVEFKSYPEFFAYVERIQATAPTVLP